MAYDGAMRRAYSPPGWPREVLPPAVPGWEESASRWLLDQCPPDFRGSPVLRHHPVVLVRFAAVHLEACALGVRRGLSETRATLQGVADTLTVDQALLAWQAEEVRLHTVLRAVGLVEEALRGRVFVERL